MSTRPFPRREPFEARVSDPFIRFGETVGRRLVNVMGNDDRSLEPEDWAESALDPLVRLRGGNYFKAISVVLQ
jgi:hypothetical protein